MWVIVIIAHTFILNLIYDLSFIQSFTDALVFNIIFALLGGSLWFMVRYSNLQSKPTIELIINHIGGNAFTMVVWMALSRFFLNGIFSEDEAYKAFLNETTTFRVISGVLYYSIIVSIYYLIINFRELKVKMARESQLNDMVKDAELKMLRSQIRPHFLFNSLNSISSLTMSNPEKAQEMVVKLSEFMRYSLNYTEEKLISLDKEIYHIQLYLDIEKVRFGKKLVMSYHIPDKCKELKLPALILQPLIENTIKYGLYEATGEIKIKIEANCETQFLFIKIGNDFDPDATPKKGTGTGLNNVQKRLETVYSAFDLMKINKQETYFEVEIKIPQHGKN